MSRGYFPLYRTEDAAKKLVQAAELVQQVIDAYRDSVYAGGDGQFDNSASGGGALALLSLARSLIIRRVQKEEPSNVVN